MRTFKQGKLWRDKAIELMEKQGSRINWRKLNRKEFQRSLKDKLIEEVHEVAAASTEGELIEELADVVEVIEALASSYEFSMIDIRVAKDAKKTKRGGFAGGMFVESAEHPEGSFGEKYCLAEPEKYPEIIE